MRWLLFRAFKVVVGLCSGKQWRKFAPLDWGYRFLFRWLRPPVARVAGHLLYVDPRDEVIARSLLLYGTWEPFETELFQQLLKTGMVAFCLGAHIGYYALLAARAVGPTGRVYAFEPSGENFRLLLKNIRVNGYSNIIPVHKAVSDATRQAQLYLNPRDTGDHRLFKVEREGPTVSVEVVRLDEWVEGREMRADLIQMDIQGSEMAALEGMQGLVVRNPSLTLLTELWPQGLWAAGTSAEMYLNRLWQLGFQLHVLDEKRRTLVPLNALKDMEPYESFLAQPNHSLNLLGRRTR